MGRSVSNAGAPAPRAAQPVSDRGMDDLGQRIAGQARKMFDDEVGARFGRGAGDLHKLSDALRGAGARLEGSLAAPYFDRAAGQLERIAELLKQTNSRELIEGMQRFAKERPLLFLGSAVALGIGAGRFLKSSSSGSSVPLLSSGSSSRAPARRAARNRNQASQPRGTSHE